MKSEIYNLSRLYQIANGDKVFVQKMISIFIDMSYDSLKDINTAYNSKEFEKLSKAAHKLKPSLADMGINSLHDTILEIEKNAVEYQTSQKLESLISELDETLKSAIIQLKDHMENTII